jgi:hypothetical protein
MQRFAPAEESGGKLGHVVVSVGNGLEDGDVPR